MGENIIDKQMALEIVKNHLIAGLDLDIEIDDRRPNYFSGYIYGLNSWPDDIWYIHIPKKSFGVGPSHYICIDKKSGKIIFDGDVGE